MANDRGYKNTPLTKRKKPVLSCSSIKSALLSFSVMKIGFDILSVTSVYTCCIH